MEQIIFSVAHQEHLAALLSDASLPIRGGQVKPPRAEHAVEIKVVPGDPCHVQAISTNPDPLDVNRVNEEFDAIKSLIPVLERNGIEFERDE